MMDPLAAISRIAGSGLQTQSKRLQIISENLANAESTGSTPGADPFRRKTISFKSEMDRLVGAELVGIRNVGTDRSPFRIEHDPGHPAADENGNVKKPNVNMLMEMADLREANRSYEANLQIVKKARSMVNATIDLLRN
ncbi:MAG: flagellar basal-body rod protein FlgC [Saliniramus fredricksonii]|uniref:Flagellar basal-body rod protein FlgC n=1 Tax=Saliniramus fredricksonii TaxID=1653334 RepID=A0A0N8KE00_9HYPH|nr:flagellar basal body rod protein FlgC [Saliniramus fredricksonii]KPQ09954.1 MAG: flagellar basal-body rod protein FlgC [Saliniramus fredricksonii]SCC80855.1 flagellar basal-body rod protein FlgC [Saliniramus fredricksonii]